MQGRPPSHTYISPPPKPHIEYRPGYAINTTLNVGTYHPSPWVSIPSSYTSLFYTADQAARGKTPTYEVAHEAANFAANVLGLVPGIGNAINMGSDAIDLGSQALFTAILNYYYTHGTQPYPLCSTMD
jgi:hypothetical protein